MAEIQLTIDGREVRAEEGMTIFEAARKAGISIPHLCYRAGPDSDHGLPPVRGGSGRGQDAGCFLRLSGGHKMVVRPTPNGSRMPASWWSSFCCPTIPTTA